MCEETLAILHQTRATSIVVTHDAEEAMRMGDRVALMRAGRIVQTGDALDLYRAPKDILAARTFSDLNELPARVEQECRHSTRPLLGQRPARWRRRHRLRAPARRAVARRRRGGAGPRSRRPASWAISPWSSLPCRGWTLRSLPACGRQTFRRNARRSAFPSMPARCWSSRRRTASRPLHNNPGARLATGLPLLP